MKVFCFLTALPFIFIFISCNKNLTTGNYKGEGFKILKINNDGTFECEKWFGNDGIDTINGLYTVKGKYLILNSHRKPNNSHLFTVKEEFRKELRGNKVIQLITGPQFWQANYNDSVMAFCMGTVFINNKEYLTDIHCKCELKNTKIKTIGYIGYWTDYPIYIVKNKKANYFLIEPICPINKNEYFEHHEYFKDEKFKIVKKTLIYKGDIILKLGI